MRYGTYLRKCRATGARIAVIGRTLSGYPILLLHKGGASETLIVGGVHAREYVTGYLLLDMIAEYVGANGVDVVPILNIDGAILAEDGLDSLRLKEDDARKLVAINGGSRDFRLWKANARGVDLNLNFDAKWGKGKGNLFRPAPSGYVGESPLSELETQAIYKVMRGGNYALVVAYHSKGEEVYWGFDGNFGYREEAERIAKRLNYTLKTTPESTGGLKDAFVRDTGRLGVTVEVGKDAYPHPYPMEKYRELYDIHRGGVAFYTELANDLWTKYNT